MEILIAGRRENPSERVQLEGKWKCQRFVSGLHGGLGGGGTTGTDSNQISK